MKIVFVSPHFPPRFKGGTEQYTYRLAKAIQASGNQVEVCCVEVGDPAGELLTHQLDFYEGLQVHRLYANLQVFYQHAHWEYDNPVIGQWFKDYLKSYRPDIVHVNSGYLISGSVLAEAINSGIKTVLTLHDYWFLCPRINLLRTSGQVCEEPVPVSRCVWCKLTEKRRYRMIDEIFDGKFGDIFTSISQSRLLSVQLQHIDLFLKLQERRNFLKRVFMQADAVICLSRFMMDKIIEYGFHHDHVHFLPFGLDSIAIKKVVKPADQPIRIGYIGQIAPHKGVHILIQAFQELVSSRQAELHIFGNENQDPRYTRRLKELAGEQDRINFRGAFENREVGEIFAEIDVLVVPSVGYENRPTVILEAFSAGVPVVASRYGGMIELIEEEQNGLLFYMGDAQDLAEKLDRLIHEEGLLERLSMGIKKVKRIDEEMHEILDLYQQLL